VVRLDNNCKSSNTSEELSSFDSAKDFEVTVFPTTKQAKCEGAISPGHKPPQSSAKQKHTA
jgi:hypothetical protein